MKFLLELFDLFEMAKSKSKREKESKNKKKRQSKKLEIGKERNWVAKNMQSTGAGAHKDRKKYTRKVKHKNREY